MDLNAKDVSCWAFSKDGSFSLKSSYLLAKGLNPLNPSSIACEWIWKATTMPRIMFFFYFFYFLFLFIYFFYFMVEHP